jgi:hypothetical protein
MVVISEEDPKVDSVHSFLEEVKIYCPFTNDGRADVFCEMAWQIAVKLVNSLDEIDIGKELFVSPIPASEIISDFPHDKTINKKESEIIDFIKMTF